MSNETKQTENHWVIGTNKWSVVNYTKEQAEMHSRNLINCSYCIDCLGCIDCIDCIDCINCSYCIDCLGCIKCSYCIDFKTNPERITSPILGSRDSQTTFYWNNEKEQIVCGCFKGTLLEFEEKIKETHGDNEFAQGYLKWIDAVKFYKETYGGNK
jgi:hypothetical protein